MFDSRLIVATGGTVSEYRSLDALVRARLRQWPQRPPGLDAATAGPDGWLRGRPADLSGATHPFLKFPGSDRLRTLPDGLWLNFGGVPAEPFVDIFAVEACGSLPNLLDKRSRFAPSTHSLMAVCPVAWLLAPVTPGDPTPRWVATRVVVQEPSATLILPVRDIRVMYALKTRHYRGFAESQIPHPHEYFVPMDALVAKDGHRNPAMQDLVSRASAKANFFRATPRPRDTATAGSPSAPGHVLQHAPASIGAVGAEAIHTDLD